MRIGELSERTNTSRRLLRYYEEQGLLFSERSSNGYRSYDERYVDRVLQIRGLLDAGLPTRIIRQILPCLHHPRVIHFPDASPEIIATLERQRDRMTERIRSLVRDRDAVAEYIDVVRDHRNRPTPESALAERPCADLRAAPPTAA
ncbi:MerR family transcriptional regulator [Streptomyces sp. MB09-02B]|uniref:MerR family transcriptional regulator n=1 Tax=Streptomyces sp. MB09-02B TaxID=3028667 RepID=UPI0029B3FC8E|nr:MerR family transcriptional regulator [Streptomyces sp. MB09-02B]MDX3638943.1 MerR family transcriptional regulator [Streptomyces sp. MB09-02B]